MKKILAFAVFTVLISTSLPALCDEFKESIINGYKNRCIEVRTKNGQKENDVRSICDCESSVLNDNFSTFQLIMAVAATNMANKPLLSEEEIREFKQKIKLCEKRPSN